MKKVTGTPPASQSIAIETRSQRAVEKKLADWLTKHDQSIAIEQEILRRLLALKASDYPTLAALREAYQTIIVNVMSEGR